MFDFILYGFYGFLMELLLSENGAENGASDHLSPPLKELLYGLNIERPE